MNVMSSEEQQEEVVLGDEELEEVDTQLFRNMFYTWAPLIAYSIVFVVLSIVIGGRPKLPEARGAIEITDNLMDNGTHHDKHHSPDGSCEWSPHKIKVKDRKNFIPIFIPSAILTLILFNFVGLYYFLYIKEKQDDIDRTRRSSGSSRRSSRGSNQAIDTMFEIGVRTSEWNPHHVADPNDAFRASGYKNKNKQYAASQFAEWAESAFNISSSTYRHTSVFFD